MLGVSMATLLLAGPLAACAGDESSPEGSGSGFDSAGVGEGPDAGDAGAFCAHLADLNEHQGADSVGAGAAERWNQARESFLGVGFPDTGQGLAHGDALPQADDSVRRGFEIYVDVLRLVDATYVMRDAVGTFQSEYPDEPDAEAKFLAFIDWSQEYCSATGQAAWQE